MANYYFQFLTAFIIFLGGVQEALLVPSPLSNINSNQVHIVKYNSSKLTYYELI